MAATISVGTVAALVFAPQQYSTTATITNNGTSTLYLGQSTVTAATGLPLKPGQSLSMTFTQSIYAVAGNNSVVSPTNTLSAGVSAAGTALTVTAGGASFTNGMVVSIQDGASSELVIVGAGATATNIPVSALAFAHNSGVTFGQFQRHNGGSVQVHAQGV